MSKIRTITTTALATAAIGSASLVASPSAMAQVPGGDQAPAPVSTQARELPKTGTTTKASATKTTTKKARSTSSTGLVFGNRSEAIRELQRKLTNAGHYVPQTGYFGTITQGALRDFQAAEGLSVTGRATERTLDALGGVSASSSSTSTVSANTSAPKAATTKRSVTSSTTASSAGAQAAVNFAYGALGTPYVYGGTTAAGYDCSGLTQAAWQAAGVSIPRTSYAQWGGLQKVSTSNLQPGDIVVFYGGSHVGIYVGGGDIIHASRPGKPVEKVSMNTMPILGAVRPA
ncbi:C40 family peptidase [Luteococcus sp. OSA5]|uniref:C40 family peptidase n=1 Tax=Luteococcus sp. OSA5 TaxID=3401630 RepID=UPI003B42F299